MNRVFAVLLLTALCCGQKSCPQNEFVGSPVNFINEYLAALLYTLNPAIPGQEVGLAFYSETPGDDEKIVKMIFVLKYADPKVRTYVGIQAGLPLSTSIQGPKRISKFIQSSDFAEVDALIGSRAKPASLPDLCGDLRLTFVERFKKDSYVSAIVDRPFSYFTTQFKANSAVSGSTTDSAAASLVSSTATSVSPAVTSLRFSTAADNIRVNQTSAELTPTYTILPAQPLAADSAQSKFSVSTTLGAQQTLIPSSPSSNTVFIVAPRRVPVVEVDYSEPKPATASVATVTPTTPAYTTIAQPDLTDNQYLQSLINQITTNSSTLTLQSTKTAPSAGIVVSRSASSTLGSQTATDAAASSRQEIVDLLDRMTTQMTPGPEDLAQVVTAPSLQRTTVTVTSSASDASDSATPESKIATGIASILSQSDQRMLNDFLTTYFDYDITTGRNRSGKLITSREFKIIYNLITDILSAPIGSDYESILDRYRTVVSLMQVQRPSTSMAISSATQTAETTTTNINTSTDSQKQSATAAVKAETAPTVSAPAKVDSPPALNITSQPAPPQPVQPEAPAAAAPTAASTQTRAVAQPPAAPIPATPEPIALPAAPVAMPAPVAERPSPQFPFDAVFNSISRRNVATQKTTTTTATTGGSSMAGGSGIVLSPQSSVNSAASAQVQGSVFRPTFYVYQQPLNQNVGVPINFQAQDASAIQSGAQKIQTSVISRPPTLMQTSFRSNDLTAVPTGTTILLQSGQVGKINESQFGRLPTTSSNIRENFAAGFGSTSFSVAPRPNMPFVGGLPASSGLRISGMNVPSTARAIPRSFPVGTNQIGRLLPARHSHPHN